MIQSYHDADCEECWVYYAGGQLFVDKEQMKELMLADGWVIKGDQCWCPIHADKAVDD